jgi:hypothetical protein
MTMLRVLLQGPGSISKYGRCGCAKNKNKIKKAENQAKNRGWLMTNVVGAMAWFRVHFPIWKGWLCKEKKKKKGQKIRKENREWLMTNVVGAVAGSRVRRCGCAKKKNLQKNQEKNMGWLMTNVECAVSGSRAHFQIWRGLYSPPGIPPGIRLESRNSAGLITEFDILADFAWNITGIAFWLICLVSPYRVPPDSVKKNQNPWTVRRNSVGQVKIPRRSSREITIHVISRCHNV